MQLINHTISLITIISLCVLGWQPIAVAAQAEEEILTSKTAESDTISNEHEELVTEEGVFDAATDDDATNTHESDDASDPTSEDTRDELKAVDEEGQEHDVASSHELYTNEQTVMTGDERVVHDATTSPIVGDSGIVATSAATDTMLATEPGNTEDDNAVEANVASTTAASSTFHNTAPATHSVGVLGSDASTPDDSFTQHGTTTLGTTTVSSAPTITSGVPEASEAGASTGTKTIIETGAAVASGNLINVANTNVVNSEGSIIVLDITGNSTGSIDVRDGGAATTCSLEACDINNLRVLLANDAMIDNAVIVSAGSGNNQVASSGVAVIMTGDVFANANIVNIANTNIIDSEYLLAIINAFGDLNGDIILPTLHFDTSQTTPALGGSVIASSVDIENEVHTSATTGNNELENVQEGTISTGNSVTGTNIYNLVNSILASGQQVSLLLRIDGTWNGTVYGLPAGIVLTPTENGYVLNFNGAAYGVGNGMTTLQATNTATIRNNVTVSAETGGNSITNAGNAVISTGNAFANANLINVANTNVIGQNWLLGVINIFGDFNGNLSFGQPDLWVGAQVHTPNVTRDGVTVTYTITVTNNGDTVANNVELVGDISPYLHTSSTQRWQLGALIPGATEQVSFEATIGTAIEGQRIENTFTTTAREPDFNNADNTEYVAFHTTTFARSGGGPVLGQSVASDVTSDTTTESVDEKSVAMDTLEVLEVIRQPVNVYHHDRGRSIGQTITITNPTAIPLEDVQFIDLLQTVDGERVQREVWDLGTIAPYEEIVLGYEVQFTTSAPSGTYVFTSRLSQSQGELVLRNNGFIYVTPLDTEPLRAVGAPITLPSVPDQQTVTRATSTASTTSVSLPVPLVAGIDQSRPVLFANQAHAGLVELLDRSIFYSLFNGFLYMLLIIASYFVYRRIIYRA